MQHALFSFGEIGKCFQKAQRNGLDGGGGDVGLHAGPLGEQSIKPPQQAPAAGEQQAAFGHVCGQLRGRAL